MKTDDVEDDWIASELDLKTRSVSASDIRGRLLVMENLSTSV